MATATALTLISLQRENAPTFSMLPKRWARFCVSPLPYRGRKNRADIRFKWPCRVQVAQV